MSSISEHLIEQLASIVGRQNVISRPEDLLVYECDAYTLEKNLPNVVVLPNSTEEVARVVKACAAAKVPIIPRGAGTSLSGAVLAVEGGVMIALTRMNRILQVDVENRRALVEAGCVNAWITQAVNSGPDALPRLRGAVLEKPNELIRAAPGLKPRPFEIVITIPGRAAGLQQRAAVAVLIQRVLTDYRDFIAFAANL